MIVDYGGKVFDVTRSSVYQTRINDNDYTADAFITYDNTFNEAHNLTVNIRYNNFPRHGETNLNATGYDIPNNSWEYADISLANGLSYFKDLPVHRYMSNAELSYFARAQYDYKGKYLGLRNVQKRCFYKIWS